MSARLNLTLSVYTGIVVFLLALPILVVIPASFNASSSLGMPHGPLSLRWYLGLGGHPEFVSAFLVTLRVAVLSSLGALLLGVAAARALRRMRARWREGLQLLFLSPLLLPGVSLGAGMLLFMGPLRLTRSLLGLALAHTVVTLPYVTRTVYATMVAVDPSIEDAASTLGANPIRIMWHVILPIIRPALLAAATFAWIVSFDEFTVSLFIVGGKAVTLPIAMFQYTEFVIDPTILAIATVLVLLSVGIIVTVERTIGFERYFRI